MAQALDYWETYPPYMGGNTFDKLVRNPEILPSLFGLSTDFWKLSTEKAGVRYDKNT